MREDIEKQNWSKELKVKADFVAYHFIVPDRTLKDLIDLINLAQQDIIDDMPDCSNCDNRRSDEPQHNEGMD